MGTFACSDLSASTCELAGLGKEICHFAGNLCQGDSDFDNRGFSKLNDYHREIILALIRPVMMLKALIKQATTPQASTGMAGTKTVADMIMKAMTRRAIMLVVLTEKAFVQVAEDTTLEVSTLGGFIEIERITIFLVLTL